MTERWRCFVAVPLPDDLREALAGAVAPWRAEAGAVDLRWTDPAGWHLTVAFLGWVSADLIESLLDALVRPAAAARATLLSAGGLGAFPSPRRARVVWYGVADTEGRAASLADGVRRAVGGMVPRVAEDAPSRPHITLARARAQRGTDLSEWLAARSAPSGVIPIERIILYRSHVGRGPARYEPLGSVAVGTGKRTARGVEAEASVHG
jgi:RNA 2',3'-cyclic 3'-phosphodiesterase